MQLNGLIGLALTILRNVDAANALKSNVCLWPKAEVRIVHSYFSTAALTALEVKHNLGVISRKIRPSSMKEFLIAAPFLLASTWLTG